MKGGLVVNPGHLQIIVNCLFESEKLKETLKIGD
jgi:hypothetical protein